MSTGETLRHSARETLRQATVLEVRDLSVEFSTKRGVFRAVDQLSFSIQKGKTLALVGESGSGKSVTALSVMRLLPGRVAEVTGGSVLYHGQDLLKLSNRQMRDVRGAKIGMVFQEPMTCLNPVLTIGNQVREAISVHQSLSRSDLQARAVQLLTRVGISEAAARMNEYPHQFSGGMRQRVMIAMALACKPDVLIADEPTTALDVTIQAQILELFKTLQNEMNLGILLITHDLGIVSEVADDIVVLYAGRSVEKGPTADVLARPRHPYTEGLLNGIPKRDQYRLQPIPGAVPSLRELATYKGCVFANRCKYVQPECRAEDPPVLSQPAEPGSALSREWRCIRE